MDQDILIRNGYVGIPAGEAGEIGTVNLGAATVLNNLASFGMTLSPDALAALVALPDQGSWWKSVSKVLREVSGTDRGMDRHVVYKNFPREVLSMDAATQLWHQLLIYMGVPVDLLAQPEAVRPPLADIGKLRVLRLADSETQDRIYADLVSLPSRWSDNQAIWAARLVGSRNAVVLSDFRFKENGIRLAAANFDTKEFEASSATDVLRLCAALSGADISLREKVALRHFKRPERRRLLGYLAGQKNLDEDMAQRPELWKRLLQRLRPGDYGFGAVSAAYDTLYNRKVKSVSAQLSPPVVTAATLDVAQGRPGEFLRRFHAYYKHHGELAVERFLPVMEQLTTRQLVGFGAYLRTASARATLIYPPKSNWARAQVVPNAKPAIEPGHRRMLNERIAAILRSRFARAYPEGFALDVRVDSVKLQTNDQKLAEYGRGTEFDIPAETTFVRSASYWEADSSEGNVWYDNGWNFFSEGWGSVGACSWMDQHSNGHEKAAVFSGDPVSSRDEKGRACQLIDLYLDRLVAQGVRYAVWSVLCFSRKKFSEAEDVLATLQWGERAETGSLYEPSRAQMVFPLKSEAYTSYVAYIDLARRKLVYMDAALSSSTDSAGANGGRLSKMMPAYVEYLESLPTLLELLQDSDSGSIPVLYDDTATTLDGGRAYVFRPLNSQGRFEPITLAQLLAV